VPTTVSQSSENRILSSLSREDANLIAPALQQLNLPLRKQLESRNRRIEYVYFIDHGIASVVANGSVRGGIEIGIIGREGVTGLAVLMGAERSPHETYMQVGGAGRRVTAASLREAMSQSKSLHQVLLRHGFAFTIQFLSLMLGVRRSGVSVALKILEREGMVKARRGGVVIIDRDGLEECANGAYCRPEPALRR
jgi:CRP-like cAMP-binding protein